MKQYNLRLAESSEDISDVRTIRQQVFVDEQGIDPSLEWTDDEGSFVYVLARSQDQLPVGTGRISVVADVATIGRMAVLKDWRGHGVGSAILGRLMKIGKSDGAKTFTLSSQLQAISFYEAHNFSAEGDVYLDAGIEHRKMTFQRN